MWLYHGTEVTDEDLEGFKAFVYVITNRHTGRMYIGKKRLQFTSRKRRQGRTNRVITKRESDWKTYFGSSDELKSDVAKLGQKNFRREIIRLCHTLSESNYYELREQMIHDVLLYPTKFYNSYVGSRISRKQMGIK